MIESGPERSVVDQLQSEIAALRAENESLRRQLAGPPPAMTTPNGRPDLAQQAQEAFERNKPQPPGKAQPIPPRAST